MNKLFKRAAVVLLALSSMSVIASCGETPSSEDVASSSEGFNESSIVGISAVKTAKEGDKVAVKGVVVYRTVNGSKAADGFFLADSTGTCYVYGATTAAKVQAGDEVIIEAEKTYFIADSESNAAATIGYEGALQLSDPNLIKKTNSKQSWSKASVQEAVIKDIMDTPMSQSKDITGQIFHTNALIKKAPGNGFVNYYIDDIDGHTGTYSYSKANGADYAWLDEFDGKICSTYFSVINAKSTSTGGVWRFVPVEVKDESYTFDESKAPDYALKYHVVDQFQKTYEGDPELEVVTSVSSDLLNLEGITVTYASSNPKVADFVTSEGKTSFRCYETGSVTITATASYKTFTKSQDISVNVNIVKEMEHVNVKAAIDATVGDEVVVGGIVGTSCINQNGGFYLIDETGIIACKLNVADDIKGLSIGNKVVLKGTKDLYQSSSKPGFGELCLTHCTIEQNLLGSNDYSTASFIAGKTVADLAKLSVNDSFHTEEAYTISTTFKKVETNYYSNLYVTDGTNDIICYCSNGKSQYGWIMELDLTQTFTVELAPCNWNSKSAFGVCIISVTDSTGHKVLNEYNFK